jgi:CheY-like chemotaxis protein
MESSTPAPSPAQRQSIEQILQAGWYLLGLINEILDLALIESGRLSLSPEPIALGEVLGDCLGMIEPLAAKAGVTLSFPELDSASFVKADRTRLKQVLINLLSNAVKYNRHGGTVRVAVAPGAGDRLRISVLDTGKGLDAAKLAQLFQSFNRLGQESGSEEGTGIGLVVSKRLVELMGGDIGVESRVDAGSVFWIEMQPAHAPRYAAALPEARTWSALADAEPDQRHTLLCVEDNPANLMLVEKLLERRPDLRLIVARDGASGIATARRSKPDLILMDINLPGISGLTALGILCEDPATAHVPVIALSANAMPGDIEKGLAAGFFRYLTKPIRVVEFMDTLDDALQFASRHAARPALAELPR